MCNKRYNKYSVNVKLGRMKFNADALDDNYYWIKFKL